MSIESLSRRSVLASGAAIAAALAGCSGDQPSDESGTTASEPATTATDRPTPTTEPPMTETDETTSELDLREANVTEVAFEATDGAYRFDVTLYHDDDGEDGYANWWQVETLDGEQLGRRELLHAHSTAPFTRSETISIPADIECVVVRGHDQTHGYGGQAMLVTVETGATKAVQQGPDRQSMADQSCP